MQRKKALDDMRWPSKKQLADLVDAVKVAEQDVESVVLYHTNLCRKGRTQEIPVYEGRLGTTVPGCEPPGLVDYGATQDKLF